MRDSLPSADSIEKVRTVEANAAANYFAALEGRADSLSRS